MTLPDDRMVQAAMRRKLFSDGTCPACAPSGTIEAGPAGATYSEICDHGGVRQLVTFVLRDAFAALDREALIEAGRDRLAADFPHVGMSSYREWSEAVLRAVGLIP